MRAASSAAACIQLYRAERSMNNQTIPTSVGALLTEEVTIDPLSHLPSFLELTFVDVARNSGRKVLSSAWSALMTWLDSVLVGLQRRERLLEAQLVQLRSARFLQRRTVERRARLIVGVYILHVKRLRARILRGVCQLCNQSMQTFGPEMMALIMFCIDYTCMHTMGGSTACELVYGLKRSKIAVVPNISGGDQFSVSELSKSSKTCSAFLAAFFPYLKERLDQVHSRLNETGHIDNVQYSHSQISTQDDRIIRSERGKERFLQWYPYIHLTHEGSKFLYQFAYLLGLTPYWSFSLHGLGIFLRRITVADVNQMEQQRSLDQSKRPGTPTASIGDAQLQPTFTGGGMGFARTILKSHVRSLIALYLLSTIFTSWRASFMRQLRLRRRRWIVGDEDETSTSNEQNHRSKLRTPIPPPPYPTARRGVEVTNNWACPICKGARINPTASASGYVFCYRCLILHLRQEGEYCPVTHMPCSEQDVVRLYESTALRGSANGE